MLLQVLFVITQRPEGEAGSDQTRTDDHHDGEDSFAREIGIGAPVKHDGYDDRNLDDRDGDGEEEGAEWFAEFDRQRFGMVKHDEHGSEEQGRRDQRDDNLACRIVLDDGTAGELNNQRRGEGDQRHDIGKEGPAPVVRNGDLAALRNGDRFAGEAELLESLGFHDESLIAGPL